MSILSTTKVGKYDEWNTLKREHAHPKDKLGLKAIIEQAIKLKGPHVDLNWIDTGAVKDMDFLFNKIRFNGNISEWNVSNVKSMRYMFYNSSFNGDISKWNVSNVWDMQFMFFNSKFNGDISRWDVSNVRNMRYMFARSEFNSNISKWNVSNVGRVYMDYMFTGSSLSMCPPKWYKR